jgi:hypothetical protein
MANILNISKGLVIIEQYEGDLAVFSTDSEQIWCGSGNGKSITEITEEGRTLLTEMGWFIDEKLKCWTIYI